MTKKLTLCFVAFVLIGGVLFFTYRHSAQLRDNYVTAPAIYTHGSYDLIESYIQEDPSTSYAFVDDPTSYVVIDDPTPTTSIYYLAIPATLTRACILYDFDYLIAFLENNFPSLGIIYRRNGVDLLAKARELRVQIEDETQPMFEIPSYYMDMFISLVPEGYYLTDYNIEFLQFWLLLRESLFYYAHPVGHLRLYSNSERQSFARAALFHGRQRHIPLDIYNSLWGMSPNVEFRIPPDTYETITTSIIQEGSIAMLSINHDLPHRISNTDFMTITRFYQDIEGFDHLIIDMRSTLGGWSRFFTDYIASQLTPVTLTARMHSFLMAGSHNLEFNRARPIPVAVTPFSIEDLPQIFPYYYDQMSPYVIADLKHMDYYFLYAVAIPAAPRGRESLFDGKIWMLVDRFMFSASQEVATVVEATGFATLVGETTSGMATAQRITSSNMIPLPNTGIYIRYDHTLLTDHRGRPLEYGTKPHYFNRPGMCALETTLALIAEGWYRNSN